jgi:hypothetical protein
MRGLSGLYSKIIYKKESKIKLSPPSYIYIIPPISTSFARFKRHFFILFYSTF